MNLIQTIEHPLLCGREIHFRQSLGQVYIDISYTDTNGKRFSHSTALPISDHFVEDKILGAIHYSSTRLNSAILNKHKL